MRALKFGVYPIQGGRFEASYINPVTNKRRRHKFDKQKDAVKFKESIERQLVTKNYGYFHDTYVGQLIDKHLKDYPESKLRDRQNVFTSFYNEFSRYKMSALTHYPLKAWFDKIREQNNYSERTLNTIKSQINWLFRSLIDEGLIEESPLRKIKFKRIVPPRRPRVILSVDEVNQVLKNAKMFSLDGLYPYLAAVAHTGARRSEILRLTKADIDFATNLIQIRRSKNGRERFIRMSPTLERVLKERVQNQAGDNLFTNEHGTKLDSNKELTRIMNKFKAFFPIEKDWGCHALRHSFARNFLMQGRQMYQLQAILGHRSIDVTVDLYGQLEAQCISCPSPYEVETE
ncbi:MAG: tyrosine-type recombinase/integrase [Bdellovibrionales bacterium]